MIEKRKNFIINLIYGIIIVGIVFILFKYGLPFISPFVLAFIIAYLLKSPIKFLTQKCKIKKIFAAIFVVVLFYATVGILVFIIGVVLFSGIKELFFNLPDLYTSEIEPFIMKTFNSIQFSITKLDASQMNTVEELSLNLVQSLGEIISNLSFKVIRTISGYASSLPGLFIRILFTIISTFFLVIDYEKITKFLMNQLKEKHKKLIIEVKNYVVNTLFRCIISYALIMFITFTELAIGLSIIGVKDAILLALLISFFDVLPVLGTGGVIIPWLIFAAFQGKYGLAIGLLILYLVVVIIRNILEPKIVGSQMGLHPLVTLMALFVGAQLFGVLGLLGLPITLSLLKNLNDKGTINILK